ncbi:MAG: prepilin peptidase [Actinobacteria bacterium]|nr:prepilin peptidase [Actinomycetota bacterium]
MTSGWWGVGLTVGLCALAVVWDTRWRRVPNWLTYPSLLAGWLAAGLTAGWGGLATAGAGTGIGLAVLVGPWLAGWAGAGDVKLLGAIGATAGPLAMLAGFAAGSLIAGGLALRRRRWAAQTASAGGARLPYGAALAAGTLTVVVTLAPWGGSLVG